MAATRKNRPAILLFDVNETLLDLAPLEESINKVLSDESSAKLWFITMLQYSLVTTVSGQYAPLPEIGAATLQMLARNRGLTLIDEDAKKALAPMTSLPSHPEVQASLETLKEAGFRLATLTNSSQSGVKAQMENAKLSAFFERELSVETVGKYKPHKDVYLWAASEMGAKPDECMLVAAHGWDVAGAKWAGLQTAFIGRPGQQLFSVAPQPDIQVADLSGLARELAV